MIAKNTSQLQLSLVFLIGLAFSVGGCARTSQTTSDQAPAEAAPVVQDSKPEPSPGLTLEPTPPATDASSAAEPTLAPEPAAKPELAPEPSFVPTPTATKTKPVRTRTGVKNVPDKYVVKKGDTLWGIANHFLKDPWMWPEVWQVNPRIRNPHLIYPGDVIAMHYVDGKPVLILEGTPLPTSKGPAPSTSNLPVVKLGPSMRTEKLKKAVSSLPTQAIAPFLNRPYLLARDDLENAPYVVSSLEEHLVNGTGGRIYARGLEHTTPQCLCRGPAWPKIHRSG